MQVYVYYDVAAAHAADVLGRVTTMQANLADACGACRLMRRPETRADGTQTWMEVYDDVGPAFDERLRSAVAGAGLSDVTGPRHVERFVELRCA